LGAARDDNLERSSRDAEADVRGHYSLANVTKEFKDAGSVANTIVIEDRSVW
jgi:hypothetical protein